MATQGILSITRGGQVVVKIVTGANGANLHAVAAALHERLTLVDTELMALCRQHKLGGPGLVVQMGPNVWITDVDSGDELNLLYRDKFSDPYFNPRWANGTAEVVLVIEIPENEEATVCHECGMPLSSPNVYHPYAACLMFRAARNIHVVTDNLKAVVEYGMSVQIANAQPEQALSDTRAVYLDRHAVWLEAVAAEQTSVGEWVRRLRAEGRDPAHVWRGLADKLLGLRESSLAKLSQLVPKSMLARARLAELQQDTTGFGLVVDVKLRDRTTAPQLPSWIRNSKHHTVQRLYHEWEGLELSPLAFYQMLVPILYAQVREWDTMVRWYAEVLDKNAEAVPAKPPAKNTPPPAATVAAPETTPTPPPAKVSVVLSNMHHAYAQTDGTYKWPNSREGDMLRRAKYELEQALYLLSISSELSFEAWYERNESEVSCAAAETGADREADYDAEAFAEKRYEQYALAYRFNVAAAGYVPGGPHHG